MNKISPDITRTNDSDSIEYLEFINLYLFYNAVKSESNEYHEFIDLYFKMLNIQILDLFLKHSINN